MIYKYLFMLLTAALLFTSCDDIPSPTTLSLASFEANHEADESAEVIMEDLVITAGEFLDSNASGMALLPEGMMLDAGAGQGVYESAALEAPIRFNSVVPQWTVEQPENSHFHVELRTGDDPANLGQWIPIEASMDWTLPDDEDIVGDMLVVPAQDKTHQFVQYRISFDQEGAENGPLLRELRLTFIDSTAGLTAEEMIELQQLVDREKETGQNVTAESGYPKPFVISREVWCTDPSCTYTDDLTYHPVSHLIVHHTVSSTGAGGDSAAVVRAIWAFHAAGRGWGDIGYNYLVDTEGVLYEGHYGGDNVVGVHSAGANTGSMALALIGTYSEVNPPAPMFESAAALFSWKADQNDIDVFEASDTLPDIEWGLPNLMGHRDVYGTTECPGGAAHSLLPGLRNEVASRIGLESPHLYIDELSRSFAKGSGSWYEAPLQCGYNTHAWYAWSSTAAENSGNWAVWQPLVPKTGRYRIEVYAPYCNTGRSETVEAHYTVEHAEGSSSVTVNQDERVGLWTSLGEYTLTAGTDSRVYLDNQTQSESGRGVWFDAIRLLPLEAFPVAEAVLPADGSWVKDSDITFSWQIDNAEKAQSAALQIAADDHFQNMLVNISVPASVTSRTIDLEQDYADLYWRILVTSDANNEYLSGTNHFGIDSEPPVSVVSQLYWHAQGGYYQVYWLGEDATSGVDNFNIDYRPVGSATWQRWQSGTHETEAAFTPPDPEAVYEFRSQAVDRLGHKEIERSTADINTEEAIVFSESVLLPMVDSD